MSFTHNLGWSYTDSSNKPIVGSVSITADSEENASVQIPATTNNVEVVRLFTRANLKTLLLQSDQAVTIYTNNPSGSSPQDTIPLTAGQALPWSLLMQGLSACPFSGNVTALYISNPGGTVANVNIRALVHQGP